MKVIVFKNILLCSLLLLISCGRSIHDTVIYNGIEGYDYSRVPPTKKSPQRPPALQQQVPVQNVPDYYYSQPQPYQAPQRYEQPVPNPYQPQNPYAGGANGYPAAGSRFYTNPYAFDPPAQYPYYESDRYYVPPTYYGVDYKEGARRTRSNYEQEQTF